MLLNLIDDYNGIWNDKMSLIIDCDHNLSFNNKENKFKYGTQSLYIQQYIWLELRTVNKYPSL